MTPFRIAFAVVALILVITQISESVPAESELHGDWAQLRASREVEDQSFGGDFRLRVKRRGGGGGGKGGSSSGIASGLAQGAAGGAAGAVLGNILQGR